MEIGPLEYIVIGLPDDHVTSDILQQLTAIQQDGLLHVVDLLFVDKDADGHITMQEINELSPQEHQVSPSLVEGLAGLLTRQDIEGLASEIPAASLAIVVLLEHAWTLGLIRAVRRAGGTFFSSGMISPDALAQVSAELAAGQEAHYV